MARFETRDQVRLAAEGVRGTYPHSLTLYRRMSANWYAAFYADRDLLGLQGVGRGKRITSSMGTTDRQEAIKRAKAWAQGKQQELVAIRDRGIEEKSSSLEHYWNLHIENLERQRKAGMVKQRKIDEQKYLWKTKEGHGLGQQEFAAKNIVSITNGEILDYFDRLEEKGLGTKQRASMKTLLRCLYEIAMRHDYPDINYPRFPRLGNKSQGAPTYFSSNEWLKLLKIIQRMSGGNAGKTLDRAEFLAVSFSKSNNLCQRNFIELYDCLLLMNHCLLRVQDLYRVRISHFSPYVDKRTGVSALEISLPDPKTKQLKKTYSTTERAIEYWKRIKSRSEKKDSYCFLPQYDRPPGNPENGRTYKVLRQCFKAALKEADLETDSFGRPHTLTSVRHTAFMLVLERNEGRIDLQTLAQNGHTSVEMLSRTYLAHHNVKRRLPDLLHGSDLLKSQ